MKLALGFRPHSDWTVVVAVGNVDLPQVVFRGTLDCGDPSIPTQVFHAAAELDLEQAAALVARAENVMGTVTAAAVSGVIDELHGHDIVAAGLSGTLDVAPDSLSKILSSHVLLHTAEGEFICRVLVEAATGQGLGVYQVPPRELVSRACTTFQLEEPQLRQMLADIGKPLGPPWRRDEKDATLAAWLALRHRVRTRER